MASVVAKSQPTKYIHQRQLHSQRLSKESSSGRSPSVINLLDWFSLSNLRHRFCLRRLRPYISTVCGSCPYVTKSSNQTVARCSWWYAVLFVVLMLFTLALNIAHVFTVDMYDIRNKAIYPKHSLQFLLRHGVEEALQKAESLIFSSPTNHIWEAKLLKPSYQLVIDSPVCDKTVGAIHLLFIIVSHPKDRSARNAIRNTWLKMKSSASDKIKTKHLFILGEPKNGSTMVHSLEGERLQHQDILQFSVVDNRRNLTLKTVSALRWVSSRCANVDYVIKTDSDMWLNINQWISAIQKDNEDNLQKSMFGICRRNVPSIRLPWSPYHSSFRDQNSYRRWSYCIGAGFGLSKQAVKAIANMSHGEPFFPVEDRFIGYCIQKLGYQIYPVKEMTIGSYPELFDDVPCQKVKQYYMIHGLKPEDMYKLYERVNTCL